MKLFDLLFVAMFIGWTTMRCIKAIQFNINCSGYLQRAATANTVETAIEELSKVIQYLNHNNITNGYTSIIYKTPDEDVEFWYNNLVNSRDELIKLSEDASNLEKSNMLIKLRESIIEHVNNSDTIVEPDGISIFPNNGLWAIIGIMLFLFSLLTIL